MLIKTDKTKDLFALKPPCPVYLECGGCDYQHVSYQEELGMKTDLIRELLQETAGIPPEKVSQIVASPKQFHYRNRLDLTMRRRKDIGHAVGFQSAGSKKLIPIESCVIAGESISNFIPQLRLDAAKKFTEKYRTANLVIKTGDDERVMWGGIGRRSLALEEKDYLWTEIHGKRVYYSLDTFFQANTFILPALMEAIRSLADFDDQTVFFDLYAGVGLFGVYFADQVKRVVMIEEVPASCHVMKYNVDYHKITNAQIHQSRVEEVLQGMLCEVAGKRKVAMIDPPRRGLSPYSADFLKQAKQLDQLLYLSCHPESLARDLTIFQDAGWQVGQVMPFDFFPRTRHVETLVSLWPQ